MQMKIKEGRKVERKGNYTKKTYQHQYMYNYISWVDIPNKSQKEILKVRGSMQKKTRKDRKIERRVRQ